VNRLNKALVWLGLGFALFSLAGGTALVMALLDEAGHATESDSWIHRLHGTPFAVLGIALAAAVIASARRGPDAPRDGSAPRTGPRTGSRES
jgi:hypothetical protein